MYLFKNTGLSVSTLLCVGKAIALQNPSSRSKRLLDGMGVRIGQILDLNYAKNSSNPLDFARRGCLVPRTDGRGNAQVGGMSDAPVSRFPHVSGPQRHYIRRSVATLILLTIPNR